MCSGGVQSVFNIEVISSSSASSVSIFGIFTNCATWMIKAGFVIPAEKAIDAMPKTFLFISSMTGVSQFHL